MLAIPSATCTGLYRAVCKQAWPWLLLLCLSIGSALATERAALVIGNRDYAVAPLETPDADVRAITERLSQAGYHVTRLHNLRQNEFYDAVDAFFFQHKHAKVVAFFYAGHAVQLNGKNFLVPVDIRTDDPDLLSHMFDLRYLINKLTEARAETKLVILDSCRNNIFSSNPNAASGLSELIAPSGTFVAFSTAPGSTAEDGEGKHSPYTTALLETLFRPGVKIEEAFKEVRRKVRLMTQNAQTPWESTSLVQDFFVVPDPKASRKNEKRGRTGKNKHLPVPGPIQTQIYPHSPSPSQALIPSAPASVLSSPALSSPVLRPVPPPSPAIPQPPTLSQAPNLPAFVSPTGPATIEPRPQVEKAAPAGSDKKSCLRLMSKLSLGMSPLSAEEHLSLKNCR